MDTRQPNTRQRRSSTVIAASVEQTPGRTTTTLLIVSVTEHEPHIHAAAAPTRATLRGATLLGCCDLCADVGITTPATSEGRLPGGAWAALCDAHGYRARTAKCLVIDAADAERSAA